MDRFDLRDALPEHGSTTVLEASAGTGKTFALAGLVARCLADTDVTLDEIKSKTEASFKVANTLVQ